MGLVSNYGVYRDPDGKVKSRAYDMDMAKNNRFVNPYGNLGFGPSLFLSLTNCMTTYAASGAYGGSSSEEEKDNDLTLSDVKSEINEILKRQQCDSIQEVSTKLQAKEVELNDVNKIISDANSTDINNENSIAYWDKRIKDWTNNKQQLEQGITTNVICSNKDEVNKNLNISIQRKKEIQANLKTAEKKKVELEKEIEQLKQDEKDLKSYEKKMKELDGSEELEKLTNDDTKSITSSLKELDEATDKKNGTTDSKKLKEVAEKLIEYYKKHKIGDNKTIDNTLNLIKSKVQNDKNIDAKTKNALNSIK